MANENWANARRVAYREKLLDPRWQKRRLEILNRDEFTCRACGDKTSTLHVHHFWYENDKEPWDVSEKALITLCVTCHEIETASGKEIEADFIRHVRGLGATFMHLQVLPALVPFNKIVREAACLGEM